MASRRNSGRLVLGVVALVALAGCEGSARFDDPKYGMTDETGYGRYLIAREAALIGKTAAAPRVIPRARPFDAPSAAEIEGPDALEIAEREAAIAAARATTAVTGRVASVRTSAGVPDIRTLPAASGAPVVQELPDGSLPTQRGVQIGARTVPVTIAAQQAAPSGSVSDTRLRTLPVLVRYALTQTHAPGTAVFVRTAPTRAADCAAYADSDTAQKAFLAAGGPARDSLGLDPDGDGFVCGWDPAPYRQPSGL